MLTYETKDHTARTECADQRCLQQRAVGANKAANLCARLRGTADCNRQRMAFRIPDGLAAGKGRAVPSHGRPTACAARSAFATIRRHSMS